MNLEVAFYSQPTYLFEVDRTAYAPEPNVDGAVIRFALCAQQQWPLQTDLAFLSLVSMIQTYQAGQMMVCCHVGCCQPYTSGIAQICADAWHVVAQARLAFTERRKMLRNTLQSRYSVDDLAAAFSAAGVPKNARPQQLCLEEYVAIWQHLPHENAK